LQKNPLLPDDIQQLLNKVNQDLNDALAGKEASEIKQNIKEVTKKLIDQQSEYRKELEKLATEAEDDSQLIKTAETDLKSAANLLFEKEGKYPAPWGGITAGACPRVHTIDCFSLIFDALKKTLTA
jgi:hypothetical protein